MYSPAIDIFLKCDIIQNICAVHSQNCGGVQVSTGTIASCAAGKLGFALINQQK